MPEPDRLTRAAEPVPTFGAELKRLREGRRVSQSKLGERADLDHSYVSRLESGTRLPSRDCVDNLAAALSLTVTERGLLLASARFLPDTGVPLADPALTRLQAILASKRLAAGDDQRLRVTLAVLADFAELAT